MFVSHICLYVHIINVYITLKYLSHLPTSNVQVLQESNTFSTDAATYVYVLIAYITVPNSQQLQRDSHPEVLSTSILVEIMDDVVPIFEAITGFTVTNVEGIDRAVMALWFIFIIAGVAAGGVLFTVVTCVVITIIVVV